MAGVALGLRPRRRADADRRADGVGAARATVATSAGDVDLDPLGALAAAAGEPDAERWWDDVVEHRGDGAPAFAAVAEAMAAVRGDAVPSPAEAVREAHMRIADPHGARERLAVAVVCGAWHVPALDPASTTTAADRALLREAAAARAQRSKAAVTWVPWTDRRLQQRSGYAAGVATPGWYRHVFSHPGPEGVARFFVDAAAALRSHGLAASPDHLIGASRLADALAALRGRPRSGLAEVLDSASAVLSLSAEEPVARVIDELTIGAAIGDVPPEAPQVPLARDVRAAQKAARLVPRTERRRLELDLRTPTGLRRSHLLHRLAILGVRLGLPRRGTGEPEHVPRDVVAGVGSADVGTPRRVRQLRDDAGRRGDGDADRAIRRCHPLAAGGRTRRRRPCSLTSLTVYAPPPRRSGRWPPRRPTSPISSMPSSRWHRRCATATFAARTRPPWRPSSTRSSSA